MRRVVSWIPFLFALLLALPSSHAQLFDGLPLSGLAEFVVFIAVLPLVFSPALRRLFGRVVARLHPRAAAFLLGLLIAAIVAKGVLLGAEVPGGFRACYSSAISDQPSNGCEVSYENPLQEFSATRIDTAIDFGPDDWNLSYVNELRFNYDQWAHGTYVRTRLPFHAMWSADIERRPDSRLQIAYVGEGVVQIGPDRIELPPVYGRIETLEFGPSQGRQPIVVAYRYDDGSRTQRRPNGLPPTLRILETSPGTESHGLRPLRAAPEALWTVLAGVIDAVVWLFAIVAVAFLVAVLRFDVSWLVLAAVAAVGVASVPVVGQLNLILWLGLTALAWQLLFVRRHRRRRLLVAYYSTVILMLGWLASTGLAPGRVLVRDGGSDWLAYESFARSILTTGSLRGGEAVFYYQPLSRYARFVEHAIFGDGDLLIAAFELLALNFLILWLCWQTAFNRRRTFVEQAIAASAVLLVIALATDPVVDFTLLGASESLTWVLLPAALALLFVPRLEPFRWLGVAALAVSLITRWNQAPAIFCTLAIVGVANRRQPAARLLTWALVFAAIAALPLIHNVYYGGKWVVSTTSAGIPQNLEINPFDPASRATLRTQASAHLQAMFYYGVPASYWGGGRLLWLYHGLQVVWAAAVLLLLVRRPFPWQSVAVAMVPVLYLGVHFFYQIAPYYPRHILIGYLAAGLVGVTTPVRLDSSRLRCVVP